MSLTARNSFCKISLFSELSFATDFLYDHHHHSFNSLRETSKCQCTSTGINSSENQSLDSKTILLKSKRRSDPPRNAHSHDCYTLQPYHVYKLVPGNVENFFFLIRRKVELQFSLLIVITQTPTLKKVERISFENENLLHWKTNYAERKCRYYLAKKKRKIPFYIIHFFQLRNYFSSYFQIVEYSALFANVNFFYFKIMLIQWNYLKSSLVWDNSAKHKSITRAKGTQRKSAIIHKLKGQMGGRKSSRTSLLWLDNDESTRSVLHASGSCWVKLFTPILLSPIKMRVKLNANTRRWLMAWVFDRKFLQHKKLRQFFVSAVDLLMNDA